MNNGQGSFEEIQNRLQEIVDAVSDDTLPLDDALSLYEEAVQLGLRASTLLEEGIALQKPEDDGLLEDNIVSSEESVSQDSFVES